MKNFDEKKLGIFLFFIGIIYLCISSLIAITIPSLWYDELYSLTMAHIPWNQSLLFIYIDFHPPLYYFILSSIMNIFTAFGFSDIIISKLNSIIPISLLIILGYYKIKKEFGWLTFGIFTLCITSMPKFMLFSNEIRMYSWAMFFVTASFIYLYNIIKTPNYKNWTIFIILTICASYTHYFAAINLIVIYLLLLVYIMIKKRELIKKFLIAMIISIVAYVPWLFALYFQANRSYWIAPIGIKTIISYFYYIFSPNGPYIIGNELIHPTILGTLFMIVLFGMIIYSLKNNSKDNKIKYAYIGILISILVPIVGLIISFIKYPILHYRYLFPSLGCLWLGISIILSKNYNKKYVFIPILILILIVGFIGTIDCIDHKNNTLKDFNEYNETLNNIVPQNTLIIFDDAVNYRHWEYLLNKNNTCIAVWELNGTLTHVKIQQLKEKYNVTSVYYVSTYGELLDNPDINKLKIHDYTENPYHLFINIDEIYELN